ncbi:MAG: response regulator transcription factor [Gammaproteobacteria bacterium]|nr:response regulator transcription factor [Gammaproteobacteria bacterium]MDH5736388.1 response regulator transcription factor [Gammaproteobacteria bacterium]
MKILIVDDHEVFREGLKLVVKDLADEMEILEASNYDEAIRFLVDCIDIDLVLLDLCLSGVQDVDALQLLRKQFPEIPVVVISANEDSKKVRQVLEAGAQGYITKSSNATTILNALHFVFSGNVYVPVEILNEKVYTKEVVSNSESFSHKLTPRQLDVLYILAEGKQNKEIANILDLKVSTVRAHVASILRAFSVSNRTQAVQYAMQNSLIKLPDSLN